ncbi:TLP18.3/Psb32/MOLO-1 phosphatase superfamily protein [Hydrogenispora ethanolica]|jgi:uncharacterized membrane protein|uniref:TLP18.3/Psb32/MOLO-1 phosphatase superfamily protein n=1 Tax=Hydrogenispora ethanolica TaxID=1082276 RepID=A0A4R1R9K8_HYDET|nr:TPM domain-containing protein [Hydrogenispora ethanolica]TCL62052.1 TLP18.3/Psb32/MOLO-1 phosphatase superfamily protein [Hydrogenispora ethanolica]
MIEIHKARRFFSPQEKERIMAAIGQAEKATSGEIRVHVENGGGGDPMDRAKHVFTQLGMAGTALRNGVLIYLAVSDRKFAIIGDAGIDAVVPEHFWEETKEAMRRQFREGHFAEGVCQGILSVGEHLRKNFPCRADDVNELTNEISEGY